MFYVIILIISQNYFSDLCPVKISTKPFFSCITMINKYVIRVKDESIMTIFL